MDTKRMEKTIVPGQDRTRFSRNDVLFALFCLAYGREPRKDDLARATFWVDSRGDGSVEHFASLVVTDPPGY